MTPCKLCARVGTCGKQYDGVITSYIMWTRAVAALGGFIFGYNIVVSGGVTTMDYFSRKFFPQTFSDLGNENAHYCRYNNQRLQFFTSSLYLAGLVSSFFAFYLSKRHGKKFSILLGGGFSIAGACLQALAQNWASLIVGRLLLGIGMGFATQSVPAYLWEVTPSQRRCSSNSTFQISICFGILVANVVNCITWRFKWGWRLSLGFTVIPAVIFSLGGVFLPLTPKSLIERDQRDEGKAMLAKLRGVENVDAEYDDLVKAVSKVHEVEHPMVMLLNRRYRSQFITVLLIPFLQQLSGLTATLLYTPVFLKSMSFSTDKAMLVPAVMGLLIILTQWLFVSPMSFRDNTTWMLFPMLATSAQFCTGLLMIMYLPSTDASFRWSIVIAYVYLTLVFPWVTWDLGNFLVPIRSELFPLEIRETAERVAIFTTFFFTFCSTQFFLTMLCSLKWGFFLVLASGTFLLMSIHLFFFYFDTQIVPVEEIKLLWGRHWFWYRYAIQDNHVHPINIT